MSDQYVIPGEDFHDETDNEGQFLEPGAGFIDTTAASAPAAAQRPVVFVAT